jgi:hypothetical protein
MSKNVHIIETEFEECKVKEVLTDILNAISSKASKKSGRKPLKTAEKRHVKAQAFIE